MNKLSSQTKPIDIASEGKDVTKVKDWRCNKWPVHDATPRYGMKILKKKKESTEFCLDILVKNIGIIRSHIENYDREYIHIFILAASLV